jgi:transcriptional regulator with XRE-family HTH domain
MPSIREKSHIFRSLAAAFKQVVNQHCSETGDTEDDVADALGVAKSYLNNMLNGHAPIPADVLVRATRALGNRHAIEVVGHLCCGMFIPYPTGDGDEINMGLAIREFGEFVVEYEGGKRDGRITPEELQRIETEASQAMSAIQIVLADAREQAKQANQPKGKMAI